MARGSKPIVQIVVIIVIRYEYYWADNDRYKKPTALPAPQYVVLLMDWVDAQINDAALFPPESGKKCLCSSFAHVV